MNYQIEFNPRAVKDFKKLSPEIQRRINSKLTSLQDNLQGRGKGSMKPRNIITGQKVLPEKIKCAEELRQDIETVLKAIADRTNNT